MSESPLTVEQFGRRYHRSRPWAVRHASFTVAAGTITALVGANGAGKSTLIRACLGFERPDEGRILVYGVDARNDRSRVVDSIGYVPQAASLYSALTIADHLNMARAARASFDRPYALSRVREAGLAEDRQIADLSGGEQAQVALALALGTRAPLLLLDEPLASLDPLARRDFLTALVHDIRGREATAVLSSHIVTDVEHACDSLVVLADGHLVLHSSIAAARETFHTLPATELTGRRAIGTFAGTAGEHLALVHADAGGRPASLDEIVLGHLAAARTRQADEAA